MLLLDCVRASCNLCSLCQFSKVGRRNVAFVTHPSVNCDQKKNVIMSPDWLLSSIEFFSFTFQPNIIVPSRDRIYFYWILINCIKCFVFCNWTHVLKTFSVSDYSCSFVNPKCVIKCFKDISEKWNIKVTSFLRKETYQTIIEIYYRIY